METIYRGFAGESPISDFSRSLLVNVCVLYIWLLLRPNHAEAPVLPLVSL